MLEFIVLGRIPGSQMQLTFAWVLDISCLLICAYLIRVEFKLLRQHRSAQDPKVRTALSIRHTGATLRAKIARAKISWIHLLIGPGVR